MTRRDTSRVRRGWRSALPLLRAALAVASVAALATAMSLPPPTRPYALDVAIVGIGAVLCWFVVGLLARSVDAPPRTALDALGRAPAAEAGRVTELDQIEWALLDTKWERPWLSEAVVTLLGPIVRARLLERRHVDPTIDPDAACRILGDDAWELLRRPDPSAPAGERPPVTKERLSHLIEVLEEL